MTKDEMFNTLWVKYDYCMMGYSYDELKKSLTAEEVKRRLIDEENT